MTHNFQHRVPLLFRACQCVLQIRPESMQNIGAHAQLSDCYMSPNHLIFRYLETKNQRYTFSAIGSQGLCSIK